jgi:hypothetical protein
MKLPKEVFSHLGPIPVAVVPRVKDKGNPWGMFWYGERRIDLLSKQTDASLLATLGHEMAHVALYDSGVEEGLAEDALEAICNAFGTYIAAAVRAGYITLQVPK